MSVLPGIDCGFSRSSLRGGRRSGFRRNRSSTHEATIEVDAGGSSLALVTDAERIQFGKLLPAGRGREIADLVCERIPGDAGTD